MAEYISREAAKERFKCIAIVGTDYIMERLDDVPAADVVEVRHGRWEWYVEPRYDLYSCDENFGYRCSECHVFAGEYGVDDDIYEEPPTHILYYCPNCGAKMDGKGDTK